tara:strand:+ start:915 stop:1160 length:246 start_codon:yes stop_codon:yes gene_type:complete
MAASPQYKIYQGSEYLGSLKRPSDAAALLSVLGPGSSVRLGHAKRDTLLAVTEDNFETVCDSYDLTTEYICLREEELVGQR